MIGMIKIGDKITFIPSAFMDMSRNHFDERAISIYGLTDKVTGTVSFINQDHHFIQVKYEIRGQTFYECLKTNENGDPFLNRPVNDVEHEARCPGTAIPRRPRLK